MALPLPKSAVDKGIAPACKTRYDKMFKDAVDKYGGLPQNKSFLKIDIYSLLITYLKYEVLAKH